ncbi:uncharacterized protein LOC141696078 [Apium graveolens]|uniref:uncharacterized protein LOC141696078 n=1 Tax=Apium graveolens TaxID=4045 RepID=UPI003D79274D
MELSVQYLRNASSEETKERIAANLSNFAYEPYKYIFLRHLNVLELFLDCIMKPSEKLIQFDVGGICNSCGDPANAAVITQCNGILLIIKCLSSHYAIAALCYLCDESNQDDVLKPKVVNIVKRYAASSSVRVSFSNLAQAFLDKHVP